MKFARRNESYDHSVVDPLLRYLPTTLHRMVDALVFQDMGDFEEARNEAVEIMNEIHEEAPELESRLRVYQGIVDKLTS